MARMAKADKQPRKRRRRHELSNRRRSATSRSSHCTEIFSSGITLRPLKSSEVLGSMLSCRKDHRLLHASSIWEGNGPRGRGLFIDRVAECTGPANSHALEDAFFARRQMRCATRKPGRNRRSTAPMFSPVWQLLAASRWQFKATGSLANEEGSSRSP